MNQIEEQRLIKALERIASAQENLLKLAEANRAQKDDMGAKLRKQLELLQNQPVVEENAKTSNS